MTNDFIPVNEPSLNGNEKKYLNECIDAGWISSESSFVKKFERGIANYVGRKFGIAVTNGTTALELAVRALNLEKGSEVIIPTFTIISCANAVTKNDLKPVLIDCDLDAFNMKVEDIESKINPKTKAIMVVHIYGLPVDMDPVIEIAKKYDLKIIEDAAEMLGQTCKERKCGSFGDVSILSFYPNKIVTTGEGGMLLCDDEKLAEKCRSLRNLCLTKDRFIHEEIGYNFRMTNLQAAVGLAQLERINKSIEKKRWIGNMHQDLLNDIEMIKLPIKSTSFAENIYWVVPIVLKDDYKKTAREVMEKLKNFGIGTRPFFYPMHKQPVFNKMGLFINEKYPNSEKLYENGFYIPSGIAITKKQIMEVSDALHQVLI